MGARAHRFCKTVITEACRKGSFLKAEAIPPTVLATLLPPTEATENPASIVKKARDTIFLIKASPIDDEFALWLAPKLEAEGYRITSQTS